MNYGYLRAIENCSEKRDISYSNQIKILESHELDKVYIDLINKNNKNCLAYFELEEIIQPGDIIYITKLSRLGEELPDIAVKYRKIISKQAKIIVSDLPSCNDNIILEALKMFEVYENDKLYEKKCIGMLKSKNRMKTSSLLSPGKPKKYSQKQLNEAIKLREIYTLKEASAITGISESTIKRATRKMK